MLLRLSHVYIDAIRKISGAFFEFPENSRKGHRFLLEFSESYQLFFQIGRSIRELDALRCSGFFCFQIVFILRIDRSE